MNQRIFFCWLDWTHRKGLNVMSEKPAEGKQNITETLVELDKISDIGAVNSYPVDIFFKAKKRGDQ
ncbi:DUF4835 family protein [Bacteroidetes bacterium endosymbiont of Geopemphigus sp.]|uniref:type IX secretion component PorD family protein n=1 Tax=Bacteroidetes bacterium endosymbiont of Geopemphigus sp. TaxID=2047937 RepID=UPI0018A8496F|nr:DUF4835 family protein [Bacteroidetes bacterium endosymbiont of Geopemphigus sp.]